MEIKKPDVKKKTPVHLLARFSDPLMEGEDTIEEHNQGVNHNGAVWFGKMGSIVAQSHIELINKQVHNGIPTCIYLVKGNRRKSTAYRGKVSFASKSLPENVKHLVRACYSDLGIPELVQSADKKFT